MMAVNDGGIVNLVSCITGYWHRQDFRSPFCQLLAALDYLSGMMQECEIKMNDLILYQFSRCLVEVGDASDFLKRFGRYRLPVGRQLGGMMGEMVLFVEGYDEDPREIYAIPEVRAFYQNLWQRWPYWLYFCHLEAENLMMMVMCCLDSMDALKVKGREQVQVRLEPLEVLQFISSGFGPMNELCERAGMSERQIFERTKAVFEYFNLPFEAAPPD
jgi:hypothetical protein